LSAKALPAPGIPRSLEDLTPEWLTAVLRARGFLGDARVVSREAEILGEGEGFVGQIIRLRLAFDRPAPAAPASLIAKLPIGLARNRRAGEALGAYEREIRFYTELADRVPIRKPACYHADMDPNPAAGREREVVRFLDRLPRWLVRILLPLFLWLAARSPRRYVLLLEDMAPRRLGDQVAGCTRDEAEAALRQLARIHASWWQHGDLDRVTWLLPVNVLGNYLEVLYRKSLAGFLTGFGAGLSEEFLSVAKSLGEKGPEIIRRIGDSPFTLLHGDYRLDNMFFEGEGRSSRITAFDWQTVAQGPAALDVAYFLSGNLAAELAAESASELLRIYWEALAEQGVSGYDLDALTRDYHVAMHYIAYRIVAGVDMLDFSDERGTALIREWLVRLQALVDPRAIA
jgi:thiamine kinase-like enzyme